MRTLLLAALALLLSAPAASAQAATGTFMPYLGYNLESDNALIGVGYRAGFPLPAPVRLALQPSIEYVFTDADVTLLQADVNVLAELNAATVAPYVGAGLAVVYADTEFTDGNTELGLNVVGGVVLNPIGFAQPFAQARYTTYDGGDALSVMGGVALGL